jgi:hypothetical protein
MTSFLALLETFQDLVIEAARNHRASLKNPSKTPDEYLAELDAQGLRRSVTALRELVAGRLPSFSAMMELGRSRAVLGCGNP